MLPIKQLVKNVACSNCFNRMLVLQTGLFRVVELNCVRVVIVSVRLSTIEVVRRIRSL